MKKASVAKKPCLGFETPKKVKTMRQAKLELQDRKFSVYSTAAADYTGETAVTAATIHKKGGRNV